MATQRAVDTRTVLRNLLAQVSGETVRLRDTAQSLIAHVSRIANDADVAVVDEVLIEEALGGEASARLAQPPADTDLVVKISDVAAAEMAVGLGRAVVTFSKPLSKGDTVVVSYTHLGLRSELIDLYRATGENIRDTVAEVSRARALIAALGPYLS